MSKLLEYLVGEPDEEDKDEDFEISEDLKNYFVKTPETNNTNSKFDIFEKVFKQDSKIKQNHLKKREKKLRIEHEEKEEIKKQDTNEFSGTILNEIRSHLDINQSMNMKVNPIEFNSVQIVSINQKFAKEVKKMEEELIKTRNIQYGELIYDLYEKVASNLDELEFTNVDTIDCLRRCYHAETTIGNSIFIHGGMNKSKQWLSDLIIYKCKENKLYSLKNCLPGKLLRQDAQGKSQCQIPPLSNHKMVSFYSNFLLIVGSPNGSKQLEFYLIENVNDFKDYHIGYQNHGSGRTLQSSINPPIVLSERISSRFDFSLSSPGNHGSLYLFGGRKANSATGLSDFYFIKFTTSNLDCEFHVSTLKKNSPPARYGHSCCDKLSEFYIFGGRNKEKFYNDLHCYSISNETWKEILVTSLPSTSLHASLNNFSNFFFLYGGMKPNFEESSEIYIFEIQNQQWNILKSGQIFDDLQLPIHGHSTSFVNSTFFTIGGCNSNEIIDNAVEMNHISDISHPRIISKLNSLRFVMNDLILILSDSEGNKGEIPVHKSIVSLRCSYFNQLLEQNKNIQKIELKNYSLEMMKCYIDFLYSGTLKINKKETIESLLNFLKTFNSKNYDIIRRLCAVEYNSSITISNEIYENLMNDLSMLLKNDEFSDFKIVLHSTGKVFKLHKLLLSQIPGFSRIFSSGMKESVENEIELDQISESAFQSILNYIYKDSYEINSQNCVEILIFCLMYEFFDLAPLCRRTIQENLTFKLSCKMISISQLYKDSSLFRICIQYIVLHYEEVVKLDEFNEIDGNIKDEINKKIKRLNMKQPKKLKGKYY